MIIYQTGYAEASAASKGAKTGVFLARKTKTKICLESRSNGVRGPNGKYYSNLTYIVVHLGRISAPTGVFCTRVESLKIDDFLKNAGKSGVPKTKTKIS